MEGSSHYKCKQGLWCIKINAKATFGYLSHSTYYPAWTRIGIHEPAYFNMRFHTCTVTRVRQQYVTDQKTQEADSVQSWVQVDGPASLRGWMIVRAGALQAVCLLYRPGHQGSSSLLGKPRAEPRAHSSKGITGSCPVFPCRCPKADGVYKYAWRFITRTLKVPQGLAN